MKRFSGYFILILILGLVACTSKENEVRDKSFYVTDDLNEKLYFEKSPGRILTLAPNLTEMIFELGFGSKLVGSTKFCNYPAEAADVAKVGDLISVDFERVINLKPDLILITVEGNNKESYNKLKELGFKVFVSNPRSYEGIKKTMRDLAVILGVKTETDEKIKGWDRQVNGIVDKAKNTDSMKVMFIVSLQPLMLSGPNTFVNEFINMAGMKNIADDSPVPYPVYNREEVLLKNPDYILMASDMGFDKDMILKIYPEWSRLNAVKNDRVISVEGDLYFRPSPRFASALEKLFATLRPAGH